MDYDRFIPIMEGNDRTLYGHLVRASLRTLEPFYTSGVTVRNLMFDIGLRRAIRLPRTTISLGNITSGGTGKTPLTCKLACHLQENGLRPAVLLRGYGANDGRSDEAVLLQNELGSSALVVANPSRVIGAREALLQDGNIDVFLLDDGFQHRQVYRDLDLVLIDATRPLERGHVLPRGLLREPITSLRRADAVIITRADQVQKKTLLDLNQTIQRITRRSAIAHLSHDWQGYRDADDHHWPIEVLSELTVIGVCGVGNPQAFEQMLRTQPTAAVVNVWVRPDHEPYSRPLIDRMLSDAQRQGAAALVMTDKDWVKWRRHLLGESLPIPIYRPNLQLRFLDGQEALEGLLKQTLAARQRAV